MQDYRKPQGNETEGLAGDRPSPIRFAGLTFDLAACTLTRDSGEPIPLTRGEFALLRLFISRHSRALSRDTILNAIADRPLEPFDRSIDVLVSRLRRKIEPDPKAPRLIVTVPGEGYRFDWLKSENGDLPPVAENGTARPSSGHRPLLLAAAAALAVLLVIGAASLIAGLPGRWYASPTDKLASAPRLSIVVLPFENLSGDPPQGFFADVLTDDLTSDLSHLADSFVISHRTALAYKGKTVDAKEIGRELGVRYVLEGSVKRADDKIGVNARLVSTETGAQIWADRFDGERTRLGALQAEFVSRLANSLGFELVKAEALRAMRERPDNPEASDLAMRGHAILFSMADGSALSEAIALFERALTMDARNAPALVGLAHAMNSRVMALASEDPQRDIARGEDAADRALALQPDNSSANLAKAQLLFDKAQIAPAIAQAEKAIASDPNNADAQAQASFWRMFVGRSEDGFAGVEKALRLSPRDPFASQWQFYVCHLHTHLAQWEQAIDWCAKSLAGDPKNFYPLVDLVAAHAWLGHDKGAREAAAQLEKVYPGFTVQKWANIHWTDDPTFNAQYARIVEGLRRGGIAEDDLQPRAAEQ